MSLLLLAPDASPKGMDAGSEVAVSLGFEPNLGQAEGRVQFVARGADYAIALAPTGFEVELASTAPAAIGITFAGGNAQARPRALARLGSTSRYLIGADPASWTGLVPHYARIRYDEVYAGIDAVYYGNAGRLEYDLVVEPGADPGVIALDFHGVEGLRIDDAGDLVLAGGGEEVVQHRPVVYQLVDGVRRPVAGAYRLLDADSVSFELGAYDAALALVIDPVLSYSSYVGGTGEDAVHGIAVDVADRTWTVGTTASPSFAGQAGAGPSLDGYACRFTRPGSPPSCIFIGGSGTDSLMAVAIGDDGSVHLAGLSDSPDFPTINPHQPVLAGKEDMVIVRMDPELGEIDFSTYFGGSDREWATGIAVTAEGGSALVGTTYSTDFPVTEGAFQSSRASDGSDLVVAAIDAGGIPMFATLLGGEQSEADESIAVAPDGDILVAGYTHASDFPVVAAFQPLYGGGGADGFFARFDAGTGALLQSSYLGGDEHDRATAIELDRAGDIMIAGTTTGQGFHGAQPLPGHPVDPDRETSRSFLVKVSAAGDAIVFNALLPDVVPPPHDMALDVAGNAHLAGQHGQMDTVWDPQPWANPEVVVAAVSADGQRLLRLQPLEPSTITTTPCCIDVDLDGNAVVAGATNGTLPLIAAADPSYNGPDREWTTDTFLSVFSEPARSSWPGDFDGDGVDDILWRHRVTGANILWPGADATAAIRLRSVPDVAWRIAGIGDFNGDGRSDIFWRHALTGANAAWSGADARVPLATFGLANMNWNVHAVGDFDGDGGDDLAWYNVATGQVVLWHRAGQGERVLVATVPALAWDVIGAGDFDGDGRGDLLWRHAETGGLVAWRGADRRTILVLGEVDNPAWQIVAIGDYDGNDADDIAWRHMVDGRQTIWPDANAGRARTLTRTVMDYQVAASGDYDGDGDDDLLWRNRINGNNFFGRSWDSDDLHHVAGVSDQAWTPKS